MRRSALLLALSSSLLLSACADGKIILQSPKGDQITVQSEIADSTRERERGLMGRTTLEKGHGMLFAFKEHQILQFWMKKTLIPLEILFFDSDGSFVNALSMEPCKADPCPSFKSAALAQYALEVTPGFRKDNGIGMGWTIDLASVKKNANPK